MGRLDYDVIAYHGPSGSIKYDEMTVLVHHVATREELAKLADQLAQKHQPERIEFVDYQEFMAVSPSLGEWSPRDDSSLKEKDWSRRPSQKDVHFWEEHMQQGSSLQDIDENNSIRRVAERNNVDERVVKDALDKVRSWLGNGTNL